MDSKRQRELALAGGAVLLRRHRHMGHAARRAAGDEREPAGRIGSRDELAEESGHRRRSRSRWKRNGPSPERALEIHSGSSRSRRRRPSPAIVKQREQQAAEAAKLASGPVEPPPPPRIPLKYIGDMTDPKNPGKRIAILSDTRGTYYGREGEVVEGRYRIVKIGVESIELAYLDGRGRQTIRQTGQ